MDRILVIADDLTGAAEIGGIGVQHGLTARVVRGGVESGDAEAGLLVVDTDTRHRAPADAAARVRDIVASSRDIAAVELVYKKTDSVLRGPVAAELEAMRSTLGLDQVVLAPQNPSLGRVIRDGRYLLHDVPLDQTHFARDPENPRRSADVRELLGEPSGAITIVSGDSLADLAHAARRLGPRDVPAGGADFFRAVLAAQSLARQPSEALPAMSGEQLFVCGSASESSRCAAADAGARGAAVVPMPRELFESDAHERLIAHWRDSVVEALQRGGAAVMTVPHPPVAERARHVRRVVAETIGQVLSIHRPDVLWLEGGATAAAVVDAMNWRGFDVEGTRSPGVVALHTVAPPSQRLVLKPGSYAWPAGVL